MLTEREATGSQMLARERTEGQQVAAGCTRICTRKAWNGARIDGERSDQKCLDLERYENGGKPRQTVLCLRDEEVVGSNPATPTPHNRPLRHVRADFLCFGDLSSMLAA